MLNVINCNHCIKYNTLVICGKMRVICWNKLVKNAYINIRKNDYYDYDAYQNLLIIVAVVCTPLSVGGGGGWTCQGGGVFLRGLIPQFALVLNLWGVKGPFRRGVQLHAHLPTHVRKCLDVINGELKWNFWLHLFLHNCLCLIEICGCIIHA